jgi:hypothetical protein
MRGKEAKQKAMFSYVFPRRVGPTAEPLFGAAEAGVDESFRQVQFASVSEVFGQSSQQIGQQPIASPLLKKAMAGLI